MTTTIKRSASLFVATLLGAATGGLFGFASLASAAEPEPAPAPAAVTPPAPVQTAQAEPANQTGTDADSQSEMTFGHGRAAAPPPTTTTGAPPPPPAEALPVRQRPRTMEEVAGASVQELAFRSVRWRYSLNFFGDVSMSGGKPSEGEHAFGFGLGGQDVLIRG